MGAVFEAENLVLRRSVAIKVVAHAESEQALIRLCHEAQLVSAMQHPHICDIYDIGSLPGGAPYLVLERLQGETLAEHLERRRRLANQVAAEVFRQILSGLDAAHRVSIVHRDMKPENVVLTMRVGCPPHVKIVDFGFAKDISGLRTASITRPGDAIGTPRYMAPEQLLAERVDPRTDLYAVGVMLFEALTGSHPFDAPTIAQLHWKVLRETPWPLTMLRPDLPLDLERVIQRALSRAPADRFSSAREMQAAILDAMPAEEEEEDAPISATIPMRAIAQVSSSSG